MIYFIPWGDENIASSRLRVFNIIPFIENSFVGTPEQLNSYDMANYAKEYQKGDTLVIQKRPAMEELKKAKKAGARVIYDIDDYYWDKPEYQAIIDSADLVTVDTEEKQKYLDGSVVIPDSLDWDGTYKDKYEHKGIIGWTGYGNNAHYLNDLKIPEGMKLRLVASPDLFQYYKDQMAQVRPWSIAMVDKYLAECDLGVYYLPEKAFENVKGMHKLLKNWAIGLPTYTTAMPDYVKAMHEAGVGEKYLIKTGEEIKDVPFDERLRDYAMKYKAEEIAKLWQKILK